MAADTVLITNLLTFLDALGDNGREITALPAEMEIRLDRHCNRNEVEDALAFMKRKGWVNERESIFGTPRWFITEAGRNRAAQM